ncbi:MAG: hypothetical protein SGBAC_001284 [Bacillariaceae sp.]
MAVPTTADETITTVETATAVATTCELPATIPTVARIVEAIFVTVAAAMEEETPVAAPPVSLETALVAMALATMDSIPLQLKRAACTFLTVLTEVMGSGAMGAPEDAEAQFLAAPPEPEIPHLYEIKS